MAEGVVRFSHGLIDKPTGAWRTYLLLPDSDMQQLGKRVQERAFGEDCRNVAPERYLLLLCPTSFSVLPAI